MRSTRALRRWLCLLPIISSLTLFAVDDTPVLPEDDLPADLFSALSPFGLPPLVIDGADDRRARARFDLGRSLFFDPILSTDRTVACASCHRPDHGFSSPEARPRGAGSRRALRHPPSLYNRAYGKRHSWDGLAASLAEQVLLPIENENEMALPLDDALARLRSDDGYAKRFAAAFDDGVTRDNLSRALVAFVARLTRGDSPVDRFHAAEYGRLADDERQGLWLFESKGGCWKCHAGPNFSDESFHNTGVGVVDGEPEPGRAALTGEAEDRGRFKTPTLRGLTATPPYMHDGSLATLEEVVELYRRGGNANSNLDERLQPLDFSDEEARDLVAFLKALSRPSAR